MSKLVTPDGLFRLFWHDTEKDFEQAVVCQAPEIFGPRRIYVDCKRRIGAKGGKRNIPDAYLLDLSSPTKPALYVVENELSTHDPFDHIGVQLLQFSVSFPQAGRQVKEMLFDELSKLPEAKLQCEEYAQKGGFRNLDYLLEYLVFEAPFQALVVIDEATDDLDTVLKSLRFPVEVVEFRTYRREDGASAYQFEPFLADVEAEPEATATAGLRRVISDLDTVVVPARDGGFERVFLGEHRWWAVKIHPSMRGQLKYIAAYRVRPRSAITHYAPIRSIEAWKDTGKVVVNFAEPAHELGPIKLVGEGRIRAPQALRYTTFEKLRAANNLDEVF